VPASWIADKCSGIWMAATCSCFRGRLSIQTQGSHQVGVYKH
jgi:hypothetical protein